MFQSAFASFFAPVRSPAQAALPGDRVVRDAGARGRHAQALAYAARRRRAAYAARSGPDTLYWKAGAPAALARAAAIRAEGGFALLP
jgi:hypothetical protein